jgi:hypothetical protein
MKRFSALLPLPLPLPLPLALALALALSACGLKPMYAGGGSGAVAQGLASIDVAPIEGRGGWSIGWAWAAPAARRNTGLMYGWMTSWKASVSSRTIPSAVNAAPCVRAISW